MKSAIIYYSFEGNTKLIAEAIHEIIQGDILELKTENELNKKSFSKYLWGGHQALMNKKPVLQPYTFDIDNYDTLVLGTPVWAWTYSPAMNTFLSKELINDKKIYLFCCHGGAKGKIFNRFENKLSGNTFLDKINFRDPLKHQTEACVEKVKKWAKNIIK